MYATIVGNVGSLLSNLDSTAVSFREKMQSVSTYMHYKQFPTALQRRVHRLLRISLVSTEGIG